MAEASYPHLLIVRCQVSPVKLRAAQPTKHATLAHAHPTPAKSLRRGRPPHHPLHHHLPRPRLHLRRRSPHAGRSPPQPHPVGLGHRHLHPRLRYLRNPLRRPRRQTRPPPRPHPHRPLVVRLHRPHRHRHQLHPPPHHPCFLRCRRGRGLPRSFRRSSPLVPAHPTSLHERRHPHGRPDRRCPRAYPRRPPPAALRLANVLLCLRFPRCHLGHHLVSLVPRYPRRQTRPLLR